MCPPQGGPIRPSPWPPPPLSATFQFSLKVGLFTLISSFPSKSQVGAWAHTCQASPFQAEAASSPVHSALSLLFLDHFVQPIAFCRPDILAIPWRRRKQRRERVSECGEEEIRRKGRQGKPLKRNKFCRGEVKVPPCVSVNHLVLWTGCRRVGGCRASIARAVCPAYVRPQFRTFRLRTTSSCELLGLLSLIYHGVITPQSELPLLQGHVLRPLLEKHGWFVSTVCFPQMPSILSC